MTYVVQIQKKKYLHGHSHFVESVINALGLLSDFRKMKIKRGCAFEKCRKKDGRSLTFDSEVWHSRIQEHTIIIPLSHGSAILLTSNQH